MVDTLVEIIENRSKNNKNYGIILVPEGIVQFIPEMNILIKEINHFMAHKEPITDLDELFEQIV